MNKNIAVIVLSFLAISTSIAQNRTSKTYNFSQIQKIDVSGVLNIYFHHSSEEKVILETDPNIFDRYDVKVKGHELEVGMTSEKKFKNMNNIKNSELHIYSTSIYNIDISNVGKIATIDPLKFEHLDLNISGVGNTQLDLKGTNLNADFSAAGNIELAGTVKKVNINNSSVGSIKADNLNAMYLDINHSGVGNVNVYATEEISINCSAVGNLNYSGDARVKKLNAGGIGKVRKK